MTDAFDRRAPTGAVPQPAAQDRSLSVIIPAYNESGNIMATLENITTAFDTLSLPHEILVIDDGSADATAEIVARRDVTLARGTPAEERAEHGVRVVVPSRRRSGVLAHIVMVHGDNAWGWATLREFFGQHRRGRCYHWLHPRHAEFADVDTDGHLEDVHPASSTSSRGGI